MIGTQIKTLKEEIVEILLSTPASSKKIKTILSGNGYNVTLQAVYKQLNALLAAGVILKTKNFYMISSEWIKDTLKILTIRHIEYPKIKEKFIYKFDRLQNLDSYWKHIIFSARTNLKNTTQYSYCPHFFWHYVPSRESSEEKYNKEHDENKEYNFTCIGGTSDLDTIFRNNLKGKYYKIELLEIPGVKRTHHITVIEDIIISVIINNELSIKIDKVYQKDIDIEQKELQLREIFSKDQKCKIVLENNPTKAAKYRKQISKPFYIPNELK